jgi:hypothetical protein
MIYLPHFTFPKFFTVFCYFDFVDYFYGEGNAFLYSNTSHFCGRHMLFACLSNTPVSCECSYLPGETSVPSSLVMKVAWSSILCFLPGAGTILNQLYSLCQSDWLRYEHMTQSEPSLSIFWKKGKEALNFPEENESPYG